MRRLTFLLMLALAFSVCASANNQGHAADVSAIATGNWVDSTTWDAFAAPSIFDTALIGNGYTVSIGATDAAYADHVLLAPTDGQTGHLYQNGGNLSISTYLHIGELGEGTFTMDSGTADLSTYMHVGHSGKGTFTMNDGTVNLATYMHVGNLGEGTFTMSGGTVNLTTYINVGHDAAATGTVQQSGGTLNVAGDITLGKYGTGTYDLNSGAINGTGTGSDLIVGYASSSTGTFNQYAGTTVDLGYRCFVGWYGEGTCNISGGSLDAGSFIALGYGSATAKGTITQSGGAITSPDDILVGRSGIGEYTMNGGSYSGTGEGSDLLMGFYGYADGTFNQNAGTVTLGNSLWLGYLGKAEYNMTDGSLNVGTYITLGRHWATDGTNTFVGNGTINQSGGTITAGDDVLVGHYGAGTYNMTGGSLTTTDEGSDLIVGTYSDSAGGTYHAVGLFNQAAGTTISIHDHVYVGYDASGEYNMTGGSLSATGSLFVGQFGSSVGALSQSSGVISIADTAWIADYSTSTGTYTLSGDAEANFASDLNVCAALCYDEASTPEGATGTLNIEGEDVTLTVGGNLIATGGSVTDFAGAWTNSSIFSFTTGATGDVSTIDVTGYADIDFAIFDIIESSTVAGGTVLDLIEADGGISNFATATLGSATSGDWTLQLGGIGNNILQAVKAGSTLIPGDTNGDNVVDATDAARLATMWGSTTSQGAADGDFNGDTFVNMLDASILAANWTVGTEGTAVPEPGAIALVLTGLLGLAMRRRR